MTKVACLQLAPVLGDLAHNATLTQAGIDRAIAAGADVVVLPELSTSGYMFDTPVEAAGAAITRENPTLAGWERAAPAAGVVVAGGFCERGEDGLIYNSAVVFSDLPGVDPAYYRKLHLWDREKLVFCAGAEMPPSIETSAGRLSLMICYDLEFPELTRAVALAGTQLLLVPTNWPLVPRPDGERPPEAIIAMAAARGNRMAIACADRCGIERGQAWTQGTTIIGADGWVAAESREPGLVMADIDLDAALEKRLTAHADLFLDRRPELYDSLTRIAAERPG